MGETMILTVMPPFSQRSAFLSASGSSASIIANASCEEMHEPYNPSATAIPTKPKPRDEKQGASAESFRISRARAPPASASPNKYTRRGPA